MNSKDIDINLFAPPKEQHGQPSKNDGLLESLQLNDDGLNAAMAQSGVISASELSVKDSCRSLDPFDEYEKAFPKNNPIFSDVPLMESGFIKRVEVVKKPNTPSQEKPEENVDNKKPAAEDDFVKIGRDHSSDHKQLHHYKENQVQLDNMSTQIRDLVLMMETVNQKLGQLENVGNNLVKEMNDTREKVRTHQETMEVVTRRVDQLEASIKKSGDSMPQAEQFDNKVQNISQRIDDLSKKVDTNVSHTDDFEKFIGNVNWRLDKLEQTGIEPQNNNKGSAMDSSHVRGMTRKVLENDDRLDIIGEYIGTVKNDVERFDQSQKDLVTRLDELCRLQEQKNATVEDQIKGGYMELQDNIKEQGKMIKTSIEGMERNSIQIIKIEEEMYKMKDNGRRPPIAAQPVFIPQIQPTFEKLNNLSLKYSNGDKTIEPNPGAEVNTAVFTKHPVPKAGKHYFSLKLGNVFRGQNAYVVVGVAALNFKESQIILDNNCYFINPFDKMVYLNSEVQSYRADDLKPDDIINVVVDHDENTIVFKINENVVGGGIIDIAGLGQNELYPCVYFERCKDFKVSFM